MVPTLKDLKKETAALYFAIRHPRTPWYARFFLAAVVAYAVSPIDLIPDFIPVIGLLDDLILVPAGIALALKMIPSDVITECRSLAARALVDTSRAGRVASAVIIMIWVAAALLGGVWFYRLISNQE